MSIPLIIIAKSMPRDITMEMSEFQELMDKRLNKTELLDAFKQMVEMIKSHQSSNKQSLGSIESKYDQIVSDIKASYNTDMQAVKKESYDFVLVEMNKMMSDHNGRMGKVEQKITSLELNTPLRMDKQIKALADSKIIPLIPTQKQLDDRLPFLGMKIRDSLERLKDGEKLEIGAVQGLRKELDELKRTALSRVTLGGGPSGGGVGSTQVYAKDLSSSLNGVLKTFSMPAFLRIIDVKLSSAPVLRETTDWTSDSGLATLTFTSEIAADPLLLAGQSLLVLYVI